MRVLVTGADGLLGSHTVRKLLDRGFEVRILKQPGSVSPTLEGLDLEVIEGDLLGDSDLLNKAVNGCEGVFHIAAITNMWADREITFRVNVEGTRRMLDASVEQGVNRLVFVGSASSYQFGSIDSPGDETGGFPDAYKGAWYMESKYEAMQLVKRYVKEGKIEAVTIAPTFLLGSLDFRPSSGELIRQFVQKKMRVVPKGGRNFAYAPDVAEALLLAMEKGMSGETYLGAGTNLTYLDFFTKVAKMTGIEPPEKTISGWALRLIGYLGSAYASVTRKEVALNARVAKLATFGTYYSPAKAVEELGMPLTPVETAIHDSVESLYNYGHLTH